MVGIISLKIVNNSNALTHKEDEATIKVVIYIGANECRNCQSLFKRQNKSALSKQPTDTKNSVIVYIVPRYHCMQVYRYIGKCRWSLSVVLEFLESFIRACLCDI